MRPQNMQTKIFLDSGDPAETKAALELLGFLDGQTTNPTLVAKNPYAQAKLQKGEKFTKEEVYSFYKQVVTDISNLIPQGSVSIEVYADEQTTSEEMFRQAKEMWTWIPNAHIKFPTTSAGLQAAHDLIKMGGRCNMTLIFSQAQIAAVYQATMGAKKGDVFVSPFIGRLDDIGLNGMDLIRNSVEMLKTSDGHVEILAASTRSMDHLLACLQQKADIITAPFKLLQEWAQRGFPVPDSNWTYPTQALQAIKYQDISLGESWASYNYNLTHELTDKGIARFAKDWNELLV